VDRLGDAIYGFGFALELMIDEGKRLRGERRANRSDPAGAISQRSATHGAG
jgi:hypothetical protein